LFVTVLCSTCHWGVSGTSQICSRDAKARFGPQNARLGQKIRFPAFSTTQMTQRSCQVKYSQQITRLSVSGYKFDCFGHPKGIVQEILDGMISVQTSQKWILSRAIEILKQCLDHQNLEATTGGQRSVEKSAMRGVSSAETPVR